MRLGDGGGQLHAMFMPSGEEPLGTDFSELGEDNEFTWHKFHVEGWGVQDFEGHATLVMHNNTGRGGPSHGSSLTDNRRWT